ncbi:hypothetical protein LSH36_225g01061 [Paralvinella palmiformis]|uniref:Transporter n=1 Tax=Paralvinella palmiformis TaxID=53620 RepID=A0AAD9N6H7_9ANNE|nr:hypothetical protein LSH36_225g01061 [Paralvinella palmiformis]
MFFYLKDQRKSQSKDVESTKYQKQHSNSLSTYNSEDENPERGNWSGKLDFLLSCLSYAVGLGNLWRFPYLCYQNGGGAFLIPYFLMLVFAGLPMFFLELSFGQFAGEGVITIWKVCPLFQGIGWGMFIVSCFIGIYYNVVIAWTLFYFIVSFNKHVPWEGCDNHWNTPACGILDVEGIKNCSASNGVWENHTCNYDLDKPENLTTDVDQLIDELLSTRKNPSDEYFHNFVLDISDGFHDMGVIRWQTAVSLLGAWTLVCLCLIKGIKSQGKVVYFTATFPYLVLLVLLVRGLTLPGSMNGIMYYLTPQWHRLASAKVWGDAAVQIFFSLSPGWGGLITLASYNKFHNNCLRDAVVVSFSNCLTSFFAGFVIFGIIGFMAHEMQLPIDKVASDGAGLAFIVYPEVVSRLPVSPIWAILFFSMLITLGLGTQFSVITTIHTTLLDVFPDTLRKNRRPTFLIIVICVLGFLLGLTCCTRGGMYMLQLIDNYAATYSLLIITLFECIALNYVYGIKNFMKDISKMLDKKPFPELWWKVMWLGVTPAILMFIMFFTWIDYTPSKYADYHYPVWADAMGWLISMASVTAIPTVMIYKLCTVDYNGTLLEKLKFLTTPTSDWGPANEKHKQAVEVINTRLDTRIPLTEPEIVVFSEHHQATTEKVPQNSEMSKQPESESQLLSSEECKLQSDQDVC